MGQTNDPESEMEKEMQEYLDAKNKEVLGTQRIPLQHYLCHFLRSGNSDILDQMLEHQGLGTEDHEDSKDEVALMNNQVGGEKASRCLAVPQHLLCCDLGALSPP